MNVSKMGMPILRHFMYIPNIREKVSDGRSLKCSKTALRDIFTEWAKAKKANKYIIGVLKDNTKARKVYESWGGELSEYEHNYVVMNVGYPIVFYTMEI